MAGSFIATTFLPADARYPETPVALKATGVFLATIARSREDGVKAKVPALLLKRGIHL